MIEKLALPGSERQFWREGWFPDLTDWLIGQGLESVTVHDSPWQSVRLGKTLKDSVRLRETIKGQKKSRKSPEKSRKSTPTLLSCCIPPSPPRLMPDRRRDRDLHCDENPCGWRGELESGSETTRTCCRSAHVPFARFPGSPFGSWFGYPPPGWSVAPSSLLWRRTLAINEVWGFNIEPCGWQSTQ